jgi:hypothetical protein
MNCVAYSVASCCFQSNTSTSGLFEDSSIVIVVGLSRSAEKEQPAYQK